jgi:regulator of replication initiation timing
MRAQIARLVEEGERYRVERDHLREVLVRIAGVAYEAAAEPRKPESA